MCSDVSQPIDGSDEARRGGPKLTKPMPHKKPHPRVTVYMPVYNAGEFLADAIESILKQTFTDFEFIIVDDASTDKSWSLVKAYARRDPRITAIRNPINLGVSLTANIAISKARGQFLARMDADDVSLPDRLAKQISHLEKHPEVIAVGGQCFVIDEQDYLMGEKKFPTSTLKIKNMLFWAIPMQQPAMMINLAKLPAFFKWYAPNQTSAEEVDLMFRFLSFGHLSNLTDYILCYRHRPTSLSHLNPKNTFALTLQSRITALEHGYQPTFTAFIINLAQIVVIPLLPNPVINNLWYAIRGIRAGKVNYKSAVPSLLTIKSN